MVAQLETTHTWNNQCTVSTWHQKCFQVVLRFSINRILAIHFIQMANVFLFSFHSTVTTAITGKKGIRNVFRLRSIGGVSVCKLMSIFSIVQNSNESTYRRTIKECAWWFFFSTLHLIDSFSRVELIHKFNCVLCYKRWTTSIRLLITADCVCTVLLYTTHTERLLLFYVSWKFHMVTCAYMRKFDVKLMPSTYLISK